jgi:hypothetical protein
MEQRTQAGRCQRKERGVGEYGVERPRFGQAGLAHRRGAQVWATSLAQVHERGM